jgi:hypothetical protein
VLIFITAQLSVTKYSVVQQIYKGGEIYTLLGFFTAALVAGYLALFILPSLNPPSVGPIDDLRLVDTEFVLCLTSVLLVGPVLALQLENLNPLTLALKLADEINPHVVISYGLTEVDVSADNATVLHYRLITVGLRPSGVDPLRPVHEIVMETVRAQDRVLLAKLFRCVFKRVADVHGVRWNITGPLQQPGRRTIQGLLLPFNYSKERAHVSLFLLHYLVKRARNLRQEWDMRDIGRHGALTVLSDVLTVLAPVSAAEPTIQMTIYASLHICEYYREIPPFGRIEPLTSYFQNANQLLEQGKVDQALLCAQILGWISVRTRQLEMRRLSGSYELEPELKKAFTKAKLSAKRSVSWYPGREEDDPWRHWLE